MKIMRCLQTDIRTSSTAKQTEQPNGSSVLKSVSATIDSHENSKMSQQLGSG